MNRGALLLVVLLVAAAGCFGPKCGTTSGAQRSSISWTQPGLYAALASVRSSANLTVGTTDPARGFAADVPALRAEVGNFTVGSVRWGPRDAPAPHIRLEAYERRLVMLTPVDEDNATRLARAHAFLANVSLNATESWDALLLDSLHDGLTAFVGKTPTLVAYEMTAPIPGEPNAGPLLERALAANATRTLRNVAWDAWQVEIQVASRTLAFQKEDIVVRVDATDRADAALEVTMAGGREKAEADVRAAFEAAGLPPPRFGDVQGPAFLVC